MHLVYPPKFGITFVSNFSWILQSSQWFCKILGVNYDKVHYGLCENVEFNCILVRCDERNYSFFFSELIDS